MALAVRAEIRCLGVRRAWWAARSWEEMEVETTIAPPAPGLGGAVRARAERDQVWKRALAPEWRGELRVPRLRPRPRAPGARARRESLSPLISCVSLCYFPLCVGLFSWSCFIGIPVIKTWCSLGALMWPVAWATPSALCSIKGGQAGFGLWGWGVLGPSASATPLTLRRCVSLPARTQRCESPRPHLAK